jgi:uncharacterized protein involved in exopolysaccharide biosynthesis
MSQDTAPSAAEPIDDDEINLLDLLETITANLRLLIIGPLLAGLAALGISFAITPTFTAKTTFLPPQQQQSAAASMLASLGSLGGLASAATGLKNPNDQYVAFLQSRAIENALIDRFDLMTRYEAKTRTDAIRGLEGRARISAGKDGLISVEVDDFDPEFAADLANAHVQELSQLTAKLAVTEAQQRRVFFEKQLQDAQAKLTQADVALRATGISPDTLKSSPEAAVGAVAELEAQVVAQEVKIASMRAYLADTAPDMQQALTQLRALKDQVNKAGRGGTRATNETEANYVTRYRDYKYYETLYEMFAKQYELAKVDESREGAVIQVLDVATPPDYKSKPKKALIAVLATLATGFVLLLFVFVRQALSKASSDPEANAQLTRIRRQLKQAFGGRA